MIKVLEHGQKKVTCPNCKAKLIYEQEDVINKIREVLGEEETMRFIVCPDCGNEIVLNSIKR